MKITKQIFNDDTVEIDGNQFEHCEFHRCTMIFRGRATISFAHCTFDNPSWQFEDAASLVVGFIKAMSEKTGDYGLFLLLNTFPALQEAVKPHYLEKLKQEPKTNG